MKHSVGRLAGLAVGVAFVASTAQAEPARLADQEMDAVTAGGLEDLVTLTFEPAFIGAPAADHVPDHAVSKREVFTDSFVSADGAFRAEVVVSRTIHIEN